VVDGTGEEQNLLAHFDRSVHPESVRASLSFPSDLSPGILEGLAERRRVAAMTGADLLVHLLKAQDVPFPPSLCVNGLDPLYEACKRQHLRLVDVRNEQAAGYMADAVGRLTRGVGVCTSSSGVAHLNAVTGLVNAYPPPIFGGDKQ
jgi:hypothetical protein